MVFLAKATKNEEGKGGFDFGSEYNRQRVSTWLKDHVGQEIRITPVMPKRSLQQNNFYWLYLERIEFETGNNASDLHEYFKRKFLPAKFIKIFDFDHNRGPDGRFKEGVKPKETTVRIPGSTTELTKHEFGEYMDKISAETGVEIPDAVGYKKWLNSAPDAGEKFSGDKKNG